MPLLNLHNPGDRVSKLSTVPSSFILLLCLQAPTTLETLKSIAASPKGLVRGLYRGLWPTALCRMSNYAYFGSYHLIRQLTETDVPRSKAATLGVTVLSGGATGICYWLFAYQFDVIKNRIMTDSDTNPRYRGVIDTARQIYRENGLRGFYRGFSPCVLRAFPANAACFLAFEAAMAVLPEKLGAQKNLATAAGED